MAQREAFPRKIGRYALDAPFASGGMASIHLGRLLGEVGFARTVAIKRMHPHYASDEGFVASFLDEARICSRVRHTNVVPILDVVRDDGELFLVMEYLDGVSLLELLNCVHAQSVTVGERKRIPPPIVSGLLVAALRGLQAAHEACGDDGSLLEIVHRDVSPANLLVGADGVPRLIDFGVAKALGRISSTEDGQLKGKLPYMSPEQVCGEAVDRRSDLFSAAVVLWEVLTHSRLFHGGDSGAVLKRIIDLQIDPPSKKAPDLPPAIDEVVMRGLERDVERRFQTAAEMADALEAALPPATPRTIALYVERIAKAPLAKRRDALRRFEASSLDLSEPGSAPARKRREYSKRPLTFAVLGGCAAVALVAGAVLGWPREPREPRATNDHGASTSTTATGNVSSPSAAPSSMPVPAPASAAPAEPPPIAANTVATAALPPALVPSGRRARTPRTAAPKPSAGATATPLPLYGRR